MSLDEFTACFAEFDWPWFMPGLEEYKKLLQDSPIREGNVWLENADRYFPNAAAIIRWVDQPSLVPFLPCLNEEDRPRFRDAVIARMLRETRQDDGTYFETFRRINVLAKK